MTQTQTLMKCPKCGGTNVQALHVVHAAGTSNIRGMSVGLVDISDFSGVAQTQLAAMSGPLQPKPLAWPAIIAAVCFLLFVLLNVLIWTKSPFDTPGRDSGGRYVDSTGKPFPRDTAGNFVYEAHYGRAFFTAAIVSTPLILIAYFLTKQFSRNSRFNNYDLPKHVGEWRKKWVCNQCGNIFIPSINKGQS